MTGSLITVVVPVLDEASQIRDLLDHLASLPGRSEVVIVDGGSSDDTAALAQRHGIQPLVVRAPPGRALQMNVGASHASGDALLFLHADTRLPLTAFDQLARALDDPAVSGGNFALRFGRDAGFSRLLGRLYGLQRRLGIYYGDSAIWLRRTAFAGLGGYRPLPIMEDYELVRRLERSVTRCLPGPVVTSARRWERRGVVRTVASWLLIRWLYIAGVPARRLAVRFARASLSVTTDADTSGTTKGWRRRPAETALAPRRRHLT